MQLPGGVIGAMLVVMLVMFFLGFVLDFIEITFVVVPIVGPVLLGMGLDPVWLGIMIAINLQTSFLTPPFGFCPLSVSSLPCSVCWPCGRHWQPGCPRLSTGVKPHPWR
jgi:TRAP-type mannitol/chloroaromatic compound transport system permease large subunit